MIRRTIRGLGLAALLVACSDPTTPAATFAPRDRPALSLGLANGATADTLRVGETVQLTEALPKRKGKTLATPTVWSSSNAAVASVSAQGLVTAAAAGTAVVSATNSLASERATIVVQPVSAPAPAPTPQPAPTTGTVPLVSGTGAGCLQPTGGSVAEGAAGTVAACVAGAAAQSWTVPAANTTGAVRIGTSLCLDAFGSATAGAQLGLWGCHGGTNQLWTLTSAGELRSAVGLCATLGTESTPTVRLQTCAGTAAQRWTTSVGSVPAPAPTPTPTPTPAPAPSGSAVELPRAYVNTDPVTPTGVTRTVAAGGDLQGAINAAQPGDVIVLASGATYTGNFVLPAKSGDAWITIRAGAGTTLPAVGQRVTPAHAATMPKLLTPNSMSALATAPGAHHYRIVGVEVGAAPSVSAVMTLLALGAAGSDQASLAQVPHHLVLERMYVHGSATLDVRRCVALNSAMSAIIDSHLSDCHSRTNDSQAIGGWNGPGPFKIVNNYLEGAGENVMFGGGDPSIADLVPSDIEIRRNHVVKPLAWQRETWIIKNLFELKSARRVLIEANVFENCWAAQQNGFAILWKSVNQDGGALWSITSDVTFQYNVVRRVGGGINLAARPEQHPALPATRFRVAHNVFELVGDASVGGVGRLWQISEVQGVELAHNTGTATTQGIAVYGAPTTGGFVLRDNVFRGAPALASMDGRGTGTAALDYHVPGWTMRGNVALGVASYEVYPPGNLYPTSASAGGLSADLRVIAAPALGYATTDGLPPGADRAAVEQRTAGVIVP